MKYKVIKTRSQYNTYCKLLEKFLNKPTLSPSMNEEVELLTLLIEKWDTDHNSFKDLDPVEHLRLILKDHQIKPIELADLLNVSKGLVSDILNYKKGMSKMIIRKLSAQFKLSQETFNRPYDLITQIGNRAKKKRTTDHKSRIAV